MADDIIEALDSRDPEMMAQIQGCAKVGKKLQWGRNISIPLPFFYLKRIEKTKVVTGKYQIQLVDVVRLSFRRRG